MAGTFGEPGGLEIPELGEGGVVPGEATLGVEQRHGVRERFEQSRFGVCECRPVRRPPWARPLQRSQARAPAERPRRGHRSRRRRDLQIATGRPRDRARRSWPRPPARSPPPPPGCRPPAPPRSSPSASKTRPRRFPSPVISLGRSSSSSTAPPSAPKAARAASSSSRSPGAGPRRAGPAAPPVPAPDLRAQATRRHAHIALSPIEEIGQRTGSRELAGLKIRGLPSDAQSCQPRGLVETKGRRS